jgi:predicted nuclease of predicted toxin-antitoxin system
MPHMKESQLMRILLDENFPADFAKLFVGYQVFTVHSLGWSGIKNGELLRRAGEVCEVFVTLDRNLEFQQNIKVLPFGVVVVRAVSNRMRHLVPLVSSILAAADRVTPGAVERAGAQQ